MSTYRAFVSILRCSFFVTLVSLLLLLGYGFGVFDNCCERTRHVRVVHGKVAPVHQNSDHGNYCQCICHQAVPPLSAEPMRLAEGLSSLTEWAGSADEFPPEPVPVGIEYPPQLA